MVNAYRTPFGKSAAFTLTGSAASSDASLRLSRREMLERCGWGLWGLWLLAHGYGHPAPPKRPPRARTLIHIWLWGGPCHLDLFDPKPEAGPDYCGPFEKGLKTNVPGIYIGALLPRLSRHADKYTLIRSLTHETHDHETAAQWLQQLGSVGSTGATEDTTVWSSAVRSSLASDPDAHIEGASEGTHRSHSHDKKVLLQPAQVTFPISHRPCFSARDCAPGRETLFEASFASWTQATNCLEQGLEKWWHLVDEPDRMHQRYGSHPFGRSCLRALRWAERGVPWICIRDRGWDTHKRHFECMRQKLPELDQGLAALLQDLADRGLLAETIVFVGGEFGRSPRVHWESPWNGGRDHFPRAFSALVAGGGFKGGCVLGATNSTGEEVVERPVHPNALVRSILTLWRGGPQGDKQNRLLSAGVEPEQGMGLSDGSDPYLQEIMESV